MSDSVFRTRLISILPPRFDAIVSSTKLVKDIKIKDLIEALASEDDRLQRHFNEKREKLNSKGTSVALVSCFSCGRSGHKSFECRAKNSTSRVSIESAPASPGAGKNSTTQIKTNANSVTCNYCKIEGHI